MAFGWHFNQVRAGDKIRDPIQGEFFATEAISKPGEALIREGIQNSLDAAMPGEPVKVRVFISGQTATAKPFDLLPYLQGLWPHAQAERNGLRDIPASQDPCPFLVFEDFGTTGLMGDPDQWKPLPGIVNHFFNFYRAEGRSDKSEQDRGRWGVGKQVFPRSSRVSSFWGLTVRCDDGRRLLMGQSVLKSHYCGGAYYSPDGWFGVIPQTGDGLVAPVEDQALIESFRRLFRIKRADQSGLSLVVPWYDPELAFDDLARAVLRDYFWPILQARLEVSLESDSRTVVLNAEALTQDRLPEEAEPDMAPLVRLALWASQVPPASIMTIQAVSPERGWQWSEDLLGPATVEELRRRYEQGDRIALRVPVTVREKGKSARASFFDVFLVRDGSEQTGRPAFIREGIIIADVRAPRTRGVRSLVIAEDQAVASFLGDSENPAHTQWQKDSANFRGKYVSGATDLAFVIRSTHEIVRRLTEGQKTVDRTVLADLFSIPRGPEPAPAVKAPEFGEELGATDQPPPPFADVFSNASRFSLERTDRGFVIRRGEAEPDLPARLRVEVAYHVRRGNPFRRWKPTDFELDKPPLQIKATGATVEEVLGNRLVVEVSARRFRIEIDGFDRRRDLRVLVGEQKPGAVEQEEPDAVEDV
jgi:hypothetical protein